MEALIFGGLGLCCPPPSLRLQNTRRKPFPSPSVRPKTLAVSSPAPEDDYYHPTYNATRFHFFVGHSFSAAHDNSTTTTCHSSKWADRLLGDFHFFPTSETSSSSSDAALTSLLPPPPRPPPAPLESPPQRRISLPIDFYQVISSSLFPHLYVF